MENYYVSKNETAQKNKITRISQLKIKNKWKKSGIKISKNLRNIIHGYIMSDGYITINNCLQVEQSKKQIRFLNWLHLQLKSIRTNTPICRIERIHPKTKIKTISFRFYSKAILTGFRKMWYKPVTNFCGHIKYKKVLPKTLQCFFNVTVISLWFAGDGTKTIGSKGAKFEVTSFSVKERLRLKILFLTHYNLQTKIIKSGLSKTGNNQWALKIPADQYEKFKRLITTIDLIPTFFPYKLHKND